MILMFWFDKGSKVPEKFKDNYTKDLKELAKSSNNTNCLVNAYKQLDKKHMLDGVEKSEFEKMISD